MLTKYFLLDAELTFKINAADLNVLKEEWVGDFTSTSIDQHGPADEGIVKLAKNWVKFVDKAEDADLGTGIFF